MTLREAATVAGYALDAAGVLVVVGGAALATARFAVHARGRVTEGYRLYREDLGRAILLGLEFLIAGDIIRTVVTAPTLENVLVLGLVVLIRTGLSFTLHLEVEGRWPWDARERPAPSTPERA